MKYKIIIGLTVFLGFACLPSETPSKQHLIVNQEEFNSKLKTLGNQAILIDVRTPSEFNQGKIPNAINLNYYSSTFKNQVAQLDTSKIAFIYCKSGGRSAKAAKVFIQSGFKKVYDLKGGFSNYKP